MAGNAHHKRLSRDARHLIRRLLSPSLTGYRRAGVLHAQVAALDYAVNRRDRRGMPLPGDTDMKAAGQRVRIGAEVRDLLLKLQASRNLREQQALVREIRHSVLRRILIHMKRSRAIAATARRTRDGRDLLVALGIVAARRAVRAVRTAPRYVREIRPGRPQPARVVGNRKPAVRTRQPVAKPRTERALPDGARTPRGTQARTPRVRAGQ